MRLTDHFMSEEFVASSTARRMGIDNSIADPQVLLNIKSLCKHILEPLRVAYGKPITISSGYRCPRLNRAVGGVGTSQHITGQAADLVVGNADDNKTLFGLIQQLDLPFDQLIDEYNYNWVHVSYSNKHRRQVIHKKRK